MGRDGRIDALRATMRELDEAVREAEAIRGALERQRARRPFWPDRRSPKHWSSEAVLSVEPGWGDAEPSE
jgi:hypothetical protein